MMVSTFFDAGDHFGKRLRLFDHAAAVGRVDVAAAPSTRTCRRRASSCSAVNTTKVSPLVWPAAEVVEVDLILAGAERQLVLVGPLRQELRLRALELVHPGHVGFRVLLDDALDVARRRTRCRPVWSPCVCVLMMRRDRLAGDRLDPIEDRLAPAGKLRVHERHAGVGDEAPPCCRR